MTRIENERGRLGYRTHPGRGERCELTLVDDTTVSFGRDPGCDVTVGSTPHLDAEVPLVAGWLVMAHGRIIVEAAPMPTFAESAGVGRAVRRALQVTAAGGPPVPVAAGSAYSPATTIFTIEIVGAHHTWELDVAARPRRDDPAGTAGAGDADDRVLIDLTDDQRTVLIAYAEPVLAGAVDPATHDQVAAKVFMSRSQVRRHLERLSDTFYEKRLWSPDSGDTRVRVVEAARHNLLLDNATRVLSATARG